MKVLIVVPNYPSKNSYAYQFVHDRVKEYINHFEAEVFCYNNKMNKEYSHEGVKVTCGDKNKLLSYINKNSFDKIIFHFLSISNARFIYKNLKNKNVIIWFHGSDCVSYKRRTSKLNKKDNKVKYFYQLLLLIAYYQYRNFIIKKLNKKDNISFVFVSNWLKTASEKDLKIKYKNCLVIPNYINEKEFTYQEKTASDRLKILVINNYSNDIYGGDLIRDIILKFSSNKYFKKFKFAIYGTGKFFKDYTNELKKFKNIQIHEKSLTHEEINKLHIENGIFLYPKRGDSQGVSRCEAMISGVVPLASDVEAISEFSPTKTSYLNKSIDEFIESLIDIYENPKDFLEKSIEGRKFISNLCSYANTIQKEIELIKGDL